MPVTKTCRVIGGLVHISDFLGGGTQDFLIVEDVSDFDRLLLR
jgi:hypothetical protein